MRKDVKAGLVLALGVVIVAGWYYSGKKSSEPTIPLAKSGEKSATGDKKSSSKSALASRNTKKPPTRSTQPRSTQKPAGSNRTKKTDTNKDRLASSKKTDSSSNRSNRLSSKSNIPTNSSGKDTAKRGIDDVTASLSDLAKPNSQAIPPTNKGNRADGASTPSSKDKGSLALAGKGKGATGDGASAKKTSGSTSESSKDRGATPVSKKKSKPAKSKTDMDGSERYVVQPGDSFMLLAEVYYGSQSHAGFLMRANPHVKDPKRLRVGTEIRIPELPKSSASRTRTSAGLKVDPTPSGRTYVVKAGDSLTGIAEKQLGATARWKELYELNKDVIKNPDVLRSGVVLVLPKT